MSRLALCVAALAAVQSGKEPEKPKLPPFIVVITAKTAGVPPREMEAFLQGLKELKGYAEQRSRAPVGDRTEGWEEWTWVIPGEKKFDPTPLWRAFINVRTKKYQLEVTGVLSLELPAKKLFITSQGDKAKVRLMNRPKNALDDPDIKVEDRVAKLIEHFEAGKLHFKVTGEIFSRGGSLAILMSEYVQVSPPPKPKEEKK
jgi:hypothetical protein